MTGDGGVVEVTRAKTRPHGRRASVAVALAATFAAISLLCTVVVEGCLPELGAIEGQLDEPRESGAGVLACGDGVIATLDDGGDAGESCDPGDAQALGCSDCRIACEGIVDPTSGHCYFLAGHDDSYKGALDRCRQKEAHVVTLASDDEAALVRPLGGDTTASSYWVGLFYNGGEFGAYVPANGDEPGAARAPQSGPCEGCFAIGADGGALPPSPPDGALVDCLASREGSWSAVACNGESFATVCEREPAGRRASSCAGGFCFSLLETAGEKTYLLVVSPATAEQAALTCASLEGGGLVRFDSRAEREQLSREILELFPLESAPLTFWIGLAEDGGTWVWDDGLVANATTAATRPLPWGDRQPVGTLGARAFMALARGAYDTQLARTEPADQDTRASRPYVCQRRPAL